MFNEIPNETFDQRERGILRFWQENKIFEASVSGRKNAPLFTYYDGPPFATGLPHYGHLLAGTIKDVVTRFKTMEGFYVPRRNGWDCHGLPVENEIEKALNLSGAASIEAFGIANFNEECRKIVLRYTAEWKEVLQRMGRWVDFEDTYRTMDLPFMESVWWVFKQLYDKGLIYEGYKVMPFSAQLGTPLSNFEAGENYKEVDDPAITVALPLEGMEDTSLLIWTTTPWTVISNLAVMAGPEIPYVRVQDHASGHSYILAQPTLPTYFKDPAQYTVLAELKGKDLAGMRYRPPFDYFADNASQGAFRVILEESVATDEGTGLVHCAPAFGEVDFYAGQREKIGLVCPVDNNGRFTKEIPEYTGQFVKDADKDIIRRLKHKGVLFHQATLHHRYPFCWRSDTPLIYKAMTTWFVAVEKIKPALLEANAEIHWTPDHIKFGRFGKWLEAARDWAISRNRYWGTPLPIWRAEDGEIVVMGSVEELEKATGTTVKDLHRHRIDGLTFERNGKVFKRVPEVFDCWFESGSMPYAQNHYPFENRDIFEKNFPADFIAEGLDQTRGWFYTLTVLSAALFNKPAFKNVIVNGIVLAADGAKMSKRLRNYPDPMTLVHKHGADAVRLYMLHSPAVRADDLCFSEAGVELVLRQVLIPWWNAYSFFITYARIYNWTPSAEVLQWKERPAATIDRWMLSMVNKLIQDVKVGMDDYDLSRAVEPFVDFVDQLTNWYIRRCRRRFWNAEETQDRSQAFATLYLVLLNLSKIAAPFVPFLSDAIYQNLRTPDMRDSVHECDYPAYHLGWRDESLEVIMAAVQTTVSLGHSLRKEHKLKVRQPLATAYISSGDTDLLRLLANEQHLIAEELNVKNVQFSSNETDFVALRAKPNFRVLGKKFGNRMRELQDKIQQMDQALLAQLMDNKNVNLTLEDEVLTLTPEEIHVERYVHPGMIAANEGKITVALDTTLTEDLLREGIVREVINKLNTMRRDAKLAVTDRIHVDLQTTEYARRCIESDLEFICSEVLAVSFNFRPCEGTEWDLNGEAATIAITRA